MVCALKRIAVEVHNVAMHDRDIMQISSLSGHDYIWRSHAPRSDPAQRNEGEGEIAQPGRLESL